MEVMWSGAQADLDAGERVFSTVGHRQPTGLRRIFAWRTTVRRGIDATPRKSSTTGAA
jgi:hypothetical protein